MEIRRFLCKYYEKAGEMGEFHCRSPYNHQGSKRTYHSNITHDGRELFVDSCSQADENGCQRQCCYFGESVQMTTESKNIEKSAEHSGGEQNQKIGDNYSFVEKEGMCKFWKRDETNKRGYHCLSPANPEGEQKVFLTVGSSDAVQRYRKQCRRANANGEPQRCVCYPGMQNVDAESETTGKGEAVVSVVKTIAKAGAALTNPAGAIAGVVEDTVNQIIDEM